MTSVHAPVHQSPSRVVDTRPTVLITEHEVKLLTAAAIAAPVPDQPGLLSRWIANHRAARDARRRRQRYSPAHYDFLEHSAMARAMERL
ncbi:hypothetical protein ORI20_12230 [Mycobacterium sp. CVI_P3]|uniref:Antitoxin n=1 Tax=Mycobacterium pinniadriaticum TaxID=2994102 RepID=A0ABT3SD83_9MYCO|nr:hypothetical protein [Mycobacterium pinniadriaticum]MCX2931049.1 hypothetical protein [Mycobacterium pinniadriaticum]MCX2937473.1 hypothetical protein [Mycobacterium pinniadriaticum]